jgi:hypothetical protein
VEISKSRVFFYGILNNYEWLILLCLVVYATKGFRLKEHLVASPGLLGSLEFGIFFALLVTD